MARRGNRRIGKRGGQTVARKKPLVKPARATEASQPVFRAEDKRYLLCFLGISIALTALYWFIGGRNLFVFPTIFCLSVGTSKFWRGPVRRYAEKSAKI